uniref:30S ribosomal protein S1 n=1 Tax=Halosiphon tomentosus TaxID=64927 RepID=UPI002E7704FE|nr:30S ribosomal protein S1 [Halosiphon tomentosus]WAM63814.1 30S ribosomal protein S1 [Halosiphon tomentosus]
MSTSISTSKFDFNKFGLLLSKYSYQVKKNDILAGVLIGIESNYALVDLGLDQVCFLPIKELSIFQVDDPYELLNINFIGEFSIFDINTKNRRIIISLKRVESIYLWNRLRQLDFANMIIYAKIGKPLGKGKLTVFNGLKFFALNSNLPKYYSRTNNKNLFIPFKFLEIKDHFHIAHVSSKLAIFSKVNKNLTIGSVYLGNVTSTKDFGIFLNILGIRSLLHISEIYQKQKGTSIYQPGDQIWLKILSKDIERGKISVTLES